ncbi:BatD family protein [Taibaiella soli]|uniref:Uncharacterized protein n=1 Tax=Taibaiella soli TaxID=1649169 RepID=A0A2W2ABG0_9BACT|nr:BatD family protein [Taibaiella soli]PZF72755.1 hypothetical protein DN068_12920 [Taibaiella soli]
MPLRLYTFFSFLLLTAFHVSAQPIFRLEVKHSQVGTKDTFDCRIYFEGPNRDIRIIPPSLSQFDVIAGPFMSESSSVTRIGDSVTKASQEYRFKLRARHEGDILLGPAIMKSSTGKVYRSDSVLLKVVAGKFLQKETNFLVYDEFVSDLPGFKDFQWSEFLEQFQKFAGDGAFVVSAGSVYHNYNAAAGEDSMKMVAVLNEIDSSLHNRAGVTGTGTLMFRHELRNYYSVKDTTGLRAIIEKVYAAHKYNIRMATFMEQSSGWNSFFEENKLSQMRQAWEEAELKAALLSHLKDDLNMRRPVYFKFYSRAITNLQHFSDYAMKNGYGIDSMTAIEPRGDSMNCMLIISKRSTAKAEALYQMIMALRNEFNDGNDRYHGFYAGMKISPAKKRG